MTNFDDQKFLIHAVTYTFVYVTGDKVLMATCGYQRQKDLR